MKIFITGVTGFVGSHVSKHLLANGHQVTGLVRKEEEAKTIEQQGILPIIGGIQDLDLLKQQAESHDGIFHGAAANFPAWEKMNRAGVEAMVEGLKGSQKPMAMQGGSMAFGDTGKKPQDQENQMVFRPILPLKPHVDTEKWFLSQQDQGLRPSIIYGSFVYGASGAIIPSIMKKTAQDKGFSPYVGEGDNLWASVHIKDWASLISLTLTNEQAQGKYFASSAIYSLKEIAEEIAQTLGLEAKLQSIPKEQVGDLWSLFTQPLTLMNQAFSGIRAKEELHWQPQFEMKGNL